VWGKWHQACALSAGLTRPCFRRHLTASCAVNSLKPRIRRGDPLRRPRYSLYPQKLALTWRTSGGHSVGIVRSRSSSRSFCAARAFRHPVLCARIRWLAPGGRIILVKGVEELRAKAEEIRAACSWSRHQDLVWHETAAGRTFQYLEYFRPVVLCARMKRSKAITVC
jgi:hypothetical protein